MDYIHYIYVIKIPNFPPFAMAAHFNGAEQVELAAPHEHTRLVVTLVGLDDVSAVSVQLQQRLPEFLDSDHAVRRVGIVHVKVQLPRPLPVAGDWVVWVAAGGAASLVLVAQAERRFCDADGAAAAVPVAIILAGPRVACSISQGVPQCEGWNRKIGLLVKNMSVRGEY